MLTRGNYPVMRDLDLFQLALGLEVPWSVSSSSFDAEQKRFDIRMLAVTKPPSILVMCGRWFLGSRRTCAFGLLQAATAPH